jgi:RNA polymerase sigma-70 factor (ECF subfamily)
VEVNSEPLSRLRAEDTPFDLDAIFRSEHTRIVRIIVRIVHDPARAEELAAEVFWRLSRTRQAQGPEVHGWLYRAASRIAFDELRKRQRREKYHRLFGALARISTPLNPEDIHLQNEERRLLQSALAGMKTNQAQMLILRSDGFTYDEIATVLGMNPASIGKLLARAEEKLRKEYLKHHAK